MTGPTTPATGRRALGAATGVLLTGLLLSGCGGETPASSGTPTPTETATTEPAAPTAQRAPLNHSIPMKIAIPKLGVSAPIGAIGLRPDGRVEEPPLSKPNLTGWYEEGVTPGEVGPSVVLGHVDAKGRPAVFARLKDLKPGDKIQVKRQDGTTATFAVQRSQRVAKNAFPHKQVFGAALDHAALRLVTCGGAFDPASGHYKDNLIVYATLIGA